MTRPIAALLTSLCALAACSAPVSQTARELAAVETERVNATQAVAQTQAADATATAAVIWRATWDAQNVTLRQIEIDRQALDLRRTAAVLEMTRTAIPVNAESTSVANAERIADIGRWDNLALVVMVLCGSAAALAIVILAFHFNEWLQRKRTHHSVMLDIDETIRHNEMRQLLPPVIVTETTPDGDANHVAEWRAALRRCVEWGQLIGFTEAEWRRRAVVYHPEDPAANDDIGRRALMGVLDGMGVTFAGRGKERTWQGVWGDDTPLSEFARLPLPSDLPEGGCPAVKIALRSTEAGLRTRSSELIGN